MPRLSIVIPVIDEPRGLDDTLVSVLENRPANCEVLVVHNQPYHDPYNLSDEVRFVEADRDDGMVACLNRALAECRSPVVHVLTCGVEVCPGWADAALRHFGDPMTASVAAVVVDRNDRRKIISAGQGYRNEGTAWRLGQQSPLEELADCRQGLRGPDTLAAFYRASAILAVGGFSPWTGDALAGIDLALALRHAGFRCALEPQCLAHVESTMIYGESSYRHGLNVERFFWRWVSKQNRISSLIGHLALLAGQSVIGLWRPAMFLQLIGRIGGMFSVLSAPRRPEPPRIASIERPSVVAAPHFAVAAAREEQRSSRVA